MPQYTPNPFGPAAANLSALFAGPDALREAQALLAASGVKENEAGTRKLSAEAAGLEDQQAALEGLAALFEAAGIAAPQAAVMGGVARAGRGNADQIAQGMNAARGGLYIRPGAPGNDMRAGATLMGNNPGLADAFNTAEIDAARTAELRKATDVANINNAGALARQKDEQAFKAANPRAAGVPMDISPDDTAGLQELLTDPQYGYLPEGVELDPANLALLVSEAAKIYQTTRNAPGAIKEVVGRYKPEAINPWYDYILPGDQGGYRMVPNQAAAPATQAAAAAPAPVPAAAAAPAAPPQQVEATRQLGAKTYVKINGQWYEQ